jgi:hypothetical protein
MINVAAQAQQGVKIPEKRATRDSILAWFWDRVHELRGHLTICFVYYLLDNLPG